MRSTTGSGRITCRMVGVRTYGSNLRVRVVSSFEIVMRVNGRMVNDVELGCSITPTEQSISENGITT